MAWDASAIEHHHLTAPMPKDSLSPFGGAKQVSYVFMLFLKWTCAYIYINIYIYIHTCIHTDRYIYIYIYINIYIQIYISIYKYIYIGFLRYIHKYMCANKHN